MLRTFTAAAIALSLVGGAAFAQGNTPATNSAPMTQPAKADAQKTAVAPVTKAKVAKAHVRHIKHVRHVKHTRTAKHGGHTHHIKQVKGVKQPTEKTRG